jgi:hypothetical protein
VSIEKRKQKRLAHPKQPKIEFNDELRELAIALDEHRLDNNVKGWFTVPWRSGWNAIKLALWAFDCNHDLQFASPREQAIYNWLKELVKFDPFTMVTHGGKVYFEAGDLIQGIDATGVTSREEVSPLLYAALRCVQVYTAHSDGGGEVFNVILKMAFERAGVPDHLFEDVVLEARCLDAIGTTSAMCGDTNDRWRRAFSIAWKRGLFQAAYALPRVK